MKEVFETDLWSNSRAHLSEKQALFIKALLPKVKPKTVIETGFRTGRSACSVLYYGREWIEKMYSFDIDIARMDTREIVDKIKEQFPNIYFDLIQGFSARRLPEAIKSFNLKIDWATIDGDHTYNGCKTDLINVHAHMNEGGIILRDDFKSGAPEGIAIPDVDKAVTEFYEEKKEFYDYREDKLEDGKGFCVLTRK